MDDSNTIEASGVFGIPKWIMKKGMRYEVDDFIVSPPSNDDEGFMRLRYGRFPRERDNHQSSHDGAQSDLAMTVEVVGTSTVRRNSSCPDIPVQGATITFGPGVLSGENTPFSTPLSTPEPVSDSTQTSHLSLVDKCRETKTASVQDSIFPNFESIVTVAPESTQPYRSYAVSGTETSENLSSRPALESILQKGDTIGKVNPEELLSSWQKDIVDLRVDDKPKTSPQQQPKVFGISVDTIATSVRKISSTSRPCLESLLPEGDIKENSGGMGESHSSETTPEISPRHTPRPSPVLPRRVPGIAMEKFDRKISAHSYFCAKPFQQQDLQQKEIGNENTSLSVQSYLPGRIYQQEKQQSTHSLQQESAGGVVSLSSSASAQSQNLEEGTMLAQALDLSNKGMGKKRQRPKPSALREMNFWAPTSM